MIKKLETRCEVEPGAGQCTGAAVGVLVWKRSELTLAVCQGHADKVNSPKVEFKRFDERGNMNEAQTPQLSNVKVCRREIGALVDTFNLRTVIAALSDELIERGDEPFTSSFGDKKLARKLASYGRRLYGMYTSLL